MRFRGAIRRSSRFSPRHSFLSAFCGDCGVRPRIVGVIGASELSPELQHAAELIGREVAARRAVLLTGGLTGAMEAAAKGAQRAGGLTIGVLPGFSPQDANPYIDVPIVTGLSEARNIIIVRTADVLIAVGGGPGTLSEIAFALKLHKPVISLDSWHVDAAVIRVRTPEEAVARAFELLDSTSTRGL
jgi:uncharacterized protein (TIGR00725 family)